MNKTRKQKKCYSQVSNTVAGDPCISLKAKGLFLFMESKPDGWNFTIRSMAKQMKDGEDSIKTAIKELRSHGYVSYYKQSTGHGIYEMIDEPYVENPHVDNPLKGKPPRISNKEPIQKKIIKEEVEDFSQIQFIKLLRSKYMNKPLKVDDVDYYFANDGFLRTYDEDRKVSNGRAMDLYKRLHVQRVPVIQYLEAKYNKETK